jgi:hypothetical protein
MPKPEMGDGVFRDGVLFVCAAGRAGLTAGIVV